MVWVVLGQVLAILVDLLVARRRIGIEQDLEIVLLRQQLRLVLATLPIRTRHVALSVEVR